MQSFFPLHCPSFLHRLIFFPDAITKPPRLLLDCRRNARGTDRLYPLSTLNFGENCISRASYSDVAACDGLRCWRYLACGENDVQVVTWMSVSAAERASCELLLLACPASLILESCRYHGHEPLCWAEARKHRLFHCRHENFKIQLFEPHCTFWFFQKYPTDLTILVKGLCFFQSATINS